MLALKFLALGRRAVPRRPARLGQCACTIARRQRGGKVAGAGKAPEGEDASGRALASSQVGEVIRNL
jgi:hypothetical protein